jgi:iron only hydrogenase large subunit-like protein
MNVSLKHQKKSLAVVYTNEAACRDCYRCIRSCPVDAIRMVDDQAQVISDKCISCGTCINECPQDAKMYRKDLDKVELYIQSEFHLAFSIAPSFASVFEDWQYNRLPSALRELGAIYVGETAIGAAISAEATAQESKKYPNKTHICSACPAAVSYIEKYDSGKISNITNVVSPMIAHARKIKAEKGIKTKVIFVGPCTAKKAEADRPELRGQVDVALTFEELFELFHNHNIQLINCEESAFDELPTSDSRNFPLVGGLLKTAKMDTDSLSSQCISVSGIEEFRQALDSIDEENPMVIEPLFCKHGCISGPIGTNTEKSFLNRKRIIDFAKEETGVEEADMSVETFTRYTSANKITKPEFSEEEIQKILALTGKSDQSMQLNCSACGYDNCRAQVNAVLEGIASPEMCIPYMRRIAEQKNDLILETDPNGVVILDEKLNIISMNPAFRKMFYCSEAVIGRKISTLVDPESFEKVVLNKESVIRKTVKYPQYNLICHQTHYAIPESRQIIGIFANTTDSYKSQGELKKIKVDTVIQAQELIEHQISMAQEMAKFLGESTAKGEMLMNKLINSIDGKDEK